MVPTVARQPNPGTLLVPEPTSLGTARETRLLQECTICFDDLCSEAVSVFCAEPPSRRRVCRHHFHLRCALLLPTKSCPLCRAEFAEVRRMPSLDVDPAAWFDLVSSAGAAGGGAGAAGLEKPQLLTTLLTQLPLDVTAFERRLDELWGAFDVVGAGVVSRDDFLRPDGLCERLRTTLPSLNRSVVIDLRGPVPDIRTNRDGWFVRFDEDGTRALSQEEVVRALIKTHALSWDNEGVRAMRELIAEVWPVFARADADAGGLSRISAEAFRAPDGLADAIIAGMAHRERVARSRLAGSDGRLDVEAAGRSGTAGRGAARLRCRTQ